MQTVGFVFAIAPSLKRINPNPDVYAARLRAHLDYFNTQPYCASFILGAVIRMEERLADGQAGPEDVQAVKTALMAPLGALGDSLFWGALRPLSVLLAAIVLMLDVWWAPALFLLLYNAGHLGLRSLMLSWGYHSGGDATSLLSVRRLAVFTRRMKLISLTLLGGLVGTFPSWRSEFRASVCCSPGLLILGGVGIAIVMMLLPRRISSPAPYVIGLAVICLVLAFLGVV